MKLTIDRSRWLRGDPQTSALLDAAGRQCCLGFFMSACGVDDADIEDWGLPCETPVAEERRLPEQAKWLVNEYTEDDEPQPLLHVVDSTTVSKLIEANDASLRSEADREAQIADLFAVHGVNVEFVDAMPSPTLGASTEKP